MKLIEMLEGIETVIKGHDMINATSICTLEDIVTEVSGSKNEYIHALIVYDTNKVKLGERSQVIPVSVIFSDKLKADQSNKLHVHSNTLSACVEVVLLLRNYLDEIECEGLDPNNTFTDIWTDQFGDALLAGNKVDFTVTGSLGGFCELLN